MRKGSILDFMPILLILLVFSIVSILGYHILTQYQATVAPMMNDEANSIISTGAATLGYFDDLTIFILFGFAIAILIGGFYLKLHPALIGVSLFILVFVIMLTGVFSNVFIEYAGASELTEAVSHFGKTMLMWKSMPVIILVIAVIVMIVMYGMSSDKGPGGGFA